LGRRTGFLLGKTLSEIKGARTLFGCLTAGGFDNFQCIPKPKQLRLSAKACWAVILRQFPFHPNWKMTETHMVYWELFPTIDHVLPVACGGADNAKNWVTTSMLHNSAKSNCTLAELGWQLLPPGDFKQWDGLLGWFVTYLQQEQSHLSDTYIRRWHRAALAAS
jgi:hypothetical protein